MRSVARSAGALIVTLLLAACGHEKDVGFVELKTVPEFATGSPVLYLDSTRLEPPKKGGVVLRQRPGTAKLQIEAGAGQLALLCEVVVKKNRITTVTVSTLERPPRCQCRHSGTDPVSSRTCVG